MKHFLAAYLESFQIGPSYLGHGYLLSIADILTLHPDYISHITKYVYPDVAKRHRTTPGCVERNIRTVIETLWKRGGQNYLFPLLRGEKCGKRPSNTQFLALLVKIFREFRDSFPQPLHSICTDCPYYLSALDKAGCSDSLSDQPHQEPLVPECHPSKKTKEKTEYIPDPRKLHRKTSTETK